MKIAHILPASVSFPLSSHNGRYEWVIQLAKLQIENGHIVTIYCNKSSRIDGINFAGINITTNDKQTDNLATFRLAFQNNHDIYHSHFDNLHYNLANETTKQIVYTQHWWPSEDTVQLAKTLSPNNVWAVPPTSYMYEFDIQSHIQSKGFIHHGIDLSMFHATQTPKSGRLLFVSRISPGKNLDIAITIAQKTGIGLDIIGKITSKDKEYWDKLRPLIDGEHIKYLGSKNHKELINYYSSASALLFPSDISESFGLVAIESQACGTPVLMKKGGSRNELIKEKSTGFLCETVDNFINAVYASHKLKSEDCINFAKRFDINVMAERYEDLYRTLIIG